MSLRGNLDQLVSFDTSTYDDPDKSPTNRPLIDFVQQFFSALGYGTIVFSDDNKQYNLLALSPALLLNYTFTYNQLVDTFYDKEQRLPTASEREQLLAQSSQSLAQKGLGLLLSGHTDCVPFNAAEWTYKPLQVTTKGSLYYGRGTSDMKGFLACMMEYAEKLSKKYDGEYANMPLVSFLFTADEEGAMSGAQNFIKFFAADYQSNSSKYPLTLEYKISPELTRYYIQKLRPMLKYEYSVKSMLPLFATYLDCTEMLLKQSHFNLVLIGEPTTLQPVTAHKGWMARKIEIVGKGGHSSNPHAGINAMELAVDVIKGLQGIQKSLQDQRFANPDFVIPETTLNLGVIEGGHSYNSICDKVKIGFDIRPTKTEAQKAIPAMLNDFIARLNHQANQRYSTHFNGQEDNTAGRNVKTLRTKTQTTVTTARQQALRQKIKERLEATAHFAHELPAEVDAAYWQFMHDAVEVNLDKLDLLAPVGESAGHSFNNVQDVQRSFHEQMQSFAYSLLRPEDLAAVEASLESSSNSTDKEAQFFKLGVQFSDTPAFACSDQDALAKVQACFTQPRPELHVDYCTEASFLQEVGPCVVLGPGDIAQAHKVNEFIDKEQLEQCVAFLEQLGPQFPTLTDKSTMESFKAQSEQKYQQHDFSSQVGAEVKAGTAAAEAKPTKRASKASKSTSKSKAKSKDMQE